MANLRAIIETPQGSRNKLAFDHELGAFRITQSLPSGMSFPFDFGFFPGTHAADGDPLDVLVLMDGPGYPGVHVDVRLLGVLEAETVEDGKRVRNDRLIAVAEGTTERGHLRDLDDLDAGLRKEIESWFEMEHRLLGRQFRVLGEADARKAAQLLEKASTDRPRSKESPASTKESPASTASSPRRSRRRKAS
jgi:inorganic pyrophosphatase